MSTIFLGLPFNMAYEERRLPIIGVVEMGEQLPISADRVVRRLNRLQTAWRFQVLESVTPEVLGNPDFGDHSYMAESLHAHLRKHVAGVDAVIGLVNLKIAARPDGAPQAESDYFSIGDFKSVAVVTLHRSVAEYRGPTVTLDQYAAHLMIGELLLLAAKASLTHTAPRLCALDECQDRTALSECIEKAWICESCVVELKKKNVSTKMLDEARKVLKWAKRNQWPFVLDRTICHPVTSFCVGTGLGWYMSAVVTQDKALIVAAVLLVPVLAVAAHARWFIK